MAAERVVARHNVTGHTTTFTRHAYDHAWSHNGWEAIDDPSKVTKDELVELAEHAHVDTDGTKTEILDRLEQES